MNPPEIWTSATRRAWLVGLAIGVPGGLAAGVVGVVSGTCCLFQFANVFMPALAGLAGGAIAAGTTRWAGLPPENATGNGAVLGLRAGGLAAVLSGGGGFLFALLVPVASAVISAVIARGDVVSTLAVSVAVIAMSVGIAAVMSFGGVVLGVLLGAGGGAVAGVMFGKK